LTESHPLESKPLGSGISLLSSRLVDEGGGKAGARILLFWHIRKGETIMEKVSIQPKLKCYISVKTYLQDKEKKQTGLVSFAIPDLGVLFKARYLGSHYELEYVSLLALAGFIERNGKALKGQKFSFLCSSPLLVYQMTQNTLCQKEVQRHRNLALAYKRKLDFSLSWIPESQNPACNGMMDLPPIKAQFDFDFEDIQKKLP
jgi:hypothetical protein